MLSGGVRTSRTLRAVRDLKRAAIFLLLLISCAELNKSINLGLTEGVRTIRTGSIPTPEVLSPQQFLQAMYDSPGKGGCRGHYFIREDDSTVYISMKGRFPKTDSVFVFNGYSCRKIHLAAELPGYRLLDSCRLNRTLDDAVASQPEVRAFHSIRGYTSADGEEKTRLRLSSGNIFVTDSISCVKQKHGSPDRMLNIRYCFVLSAETFRVLSSSVCSGDSL
jgi:hypothetical protein